MTIIQKLSDRGSFIYEAISLCVVNSPNKSLRPNQIQWALFQAGVYIKQPLLDQALKEMREKGIMGKPEPKVVTPAKPKIIY